MKDLLAIKNKLENSDNILIITHISPDSDAYGSQCGLALALKALNKNVYLYNESDFDAYYNFIPLADSVLNEIPQHIDFDCVVYTDCGDIKRIGKRIKDLVSTFNSTINIDHHKSNDNFADLNYVEVNASSTCEMIYKFISEYIDVKITNDIATCLLAGIYGDTGSLRYSSTSTTTLEIASKLKEFCTDFNKLMEAMFSNRTLSSVKLEAKVFSDIEFILDNKVGLIVVKNEQMKACNATLNDSEGFVEKLRDIKNIDAAILIKETESDFKVSMRSKANGLNVSEIAQDFGGGGHIHAAGFNSTKSLDELKKLLFLNFENKFKSE